MQSKDVNKLIRKYSDRFDAYGVSAKTLGWNEKRAVVRFHVFYEHWDLNGASVLDFGCGFGDFLKFLKQKEVKDLKYLGVDINPNFIVNAQRLHPDSKFLQINLFEEEFEYRFDYIFASGIFNDRVTSNRKTIIEAMKLFNKYALKGFAVNFLSSRSPVPGGRLHYTDPSFILNEAYEYSKNVVLRSDYMPHEFSVFIDKASKVSREHIVYEKYLDICK